MRLRETSSHPLESTLSSKTLQEGDTATETTHMRTTTGERLGGPTRRIAIAGAVIVALVGVAIGVTLWRYSASTSKYESTLKNTATVAETAQARTAVYDVLNAARPLTTSASAAGIATLRQAGTELGLSLVSLLHSTADAPIEQAALARARGDNGVLGSTITALSQNAGTPVAGAEVDRIASLLDGVDHQLDVVVAQESAQNLSDRQ